MTARDQFGNRATIDPVRLAAFVRTDNGITRDLLQRGELVKREAQRLVGVYRPPDAYSAAHRKRKPGTLRDSIVKRISEDAKGPVVFVTSSDPIALWHHEGTRAHTIQARNKPMLVFFWPKIGRVLRIRRVRHPGTKPNRFLTNALNVLRRR